MSENKFKKRILIFSTAYYPLVGGAEVAIKEITDRLPDYEFELITAKLKSGLPKVEKLGAVTVRRVGFGFFGDKVLLALFGFLVAVNRHRQKPYDLVWGMMASFGGLGAVLFKIFFPTVPFLLTLQEGDDLKEIEKKAWLIRPWFKNIFIKADYVQCISNYLADWAKSFLVTAPIVVVPNGVDLDIFHPMSNKFVLDYKMVVTTSRLVYKNGVDTLIEAMKYVGPGIRLSIIGDGPDRDKLEQKIKDLFLTERVEIVGFLPHRDLITFLKQADLFVRASRTEGLGNSFLEAMACGVPVIGTPVGGIVDFLHDKETGLIVRPEDPKRLAEKINFVFNPANQAEMEKIKSAGLTLVQQKYNWPDITLQMRAIFDLLTSSLT
jgi:glycosyltransferase involved in cell wall biosynthesis